MKLAIALIAASLVQKGDAQISSDPGSDVNLAFERAALKQQDAGKVYPPDVEHLKPKAVSYAEQEVNPYWDGSPETDRHPDKYNEKDGWATVDYETCAGAEYPWRAVPDGAQQVLGSDGHIRLYRGTAKTYILGDEGSMDCPCHYEVVTSTAECTAAATYLGLEDQAAVHLSYASLSAQMQDWIASWCLDASYIGHPEFKYNFFTDTNKDPKKYGFSQKYERKDVGQERVPGGCFAKIEEIHLPSGIDENKQGGTTLVKKWHAHGDGIPPLPIDLRTIGNYQSLGDDIPSDTYKDLKELVNLRSSQPATVYTNEMCKGAMGEYKERQLQTKIAKDFIDRDLYVAATRWPAVGTQEGIPGGYFGYEDRWDMYYQSEKMWRICKLHIADGGPKTYAEEKSTWENQKTVVDSVEGALNFQHSIDGTSTRGSVQDPMIGEEIRKQKTRVDPPEAGGVFGAPGAMSTFLQTKQQTETEQLTASQIEAGKTYVADIFDKLDSMVEKYKHPVASFKNVVPPDTISKNDFSAEQPHYR